MPSYGFDSFLPGATRRDVAVGQQVEDEYLERARGFDAQGALETAATSAYQRLRRNMVRDLSSLRDDQAAMGRRGSRAFYDEDELVSEAYDRLGEHTASLALQANEQNLRNFTAYGAYGSGIRERGYDLATAGEELKIARENAKAQRRNRFGAALGAGVGLAVGGPGGAAAGATIGGGIF